jgi:adenosylhomocysteine nucleosidase
VSPPAATCILFALPEEGAPVVGALEGAREHRVQGREFLEGSIGGHPVIAGRTGIGKVASALAAVAVATHFRPARIVMVGATGALKSSLKLGDLFVATETIQHDLGVRDGRRSHPCPELGSELYEVALRLSPTKKAYRGTLLTGDRACVTYRRRLRLLWSFRADSPMAVDMESAALGAAAQAAGIPFGVLRIVTDHAGPLAFREIRKHFHELAPVPGRVIVNWLCSKPAMP